MLIKLISEQSAFQTAKMMHNNYNPRLCVRSTIPSNTSNKTTGVNFRLARDLLAASLVSNTLYRSECLQHATLNFYSIITTSAKSVKQKYTINH